VKRIRDVQWSGDRGEGSIFFFVDVETGARISRNLYVSYFAAGKEQLLSAKTEDLDDAKHELKRLLRNRENAREGKETLITPKLERVTVRELLEANLTRAKEAQLASVEDMGYRTDTLKELLGSVRAVDFRPEQSTSTSDAAGRVRGRAAAPRRARPQSAASSRSSIAHSGMPSSGASSDTRLSSRSPASTTSGSRRSRSRSSRRSWRLSPAPIPATSASGSS
jgi:hypothetical protein